MNWFERYSIVGLFFVASVVVWDIALYQCGWVSRVSSFKDMALILAGVALPCGYLLSVTSQLVYYHLPWVGVHKQIWRRCTRQKKCSELRAEAAMTVVIRGRANPKQVGRELWVQGFNSRRWDVVAINNSVILATLISLLVVVFFEWCRPQPAPYWILVVVVAGLVVLACGWSSCALLRQIRITLEGCYGRLLTPYVKPQPSKQDGL
jgi:hypothetical protein